jgi:hypothetical protein
VDFSLHLDILSAVAPVIQGQQLYYFQQIQQVNPKQVQPGHPVSQGIPMPTNKPLFLRPPVSVTFRPLIL